MYEYSLELAVKKKISFMGGKKNPLVLILIINFTNTARMIKLIRQYALVSKI